MRVRVKTSRALGAAAQAASEAAAKAVFAELAGRFQDALRKQVYQWPRQTIRSNDQVVYSPRNIIDTATLAQQQQAPRIEGSRAIYRWTAPYTRAVFLGARLRNGTILPPRNAPAAVLGTEPVAGIPVYDARARFREVWLKRFRG
jgi:hypothetical protein